MFLNHDTIVPSGKTKKMKREISLIASFRRAIVKRTYNITTKKMTINSRTRSNMIKSTCLLKLQLTWIIWQQIKSFFYPRSVSNRDTNRILTSVVVIFLINFNIQAWVVEDFHPFISKKNNGR